MNSYQRMGIFIIGLSIVLYMYTAPAFLLVTLGGWTGDAPNQSLVDATYIRLVNGILFASNVSMTFAGIKLYGGNKDKRLIGILLAFGVIAPLYFLGILPI